MKTSVTIGWAHGLKKLSLIRLFHDTVGYSLAKSEHLVGLLDEERTRFIRVTCEDKDAAEAFAQKVKTVGAACEVSIK